MYWLLIIPGKPRLISSKQTFSQKVVQVNFKLTCYCVFTQKNQINQIKFQLFINLKKLILDPKWTLWARKSHNTIFFIKSGCHFRRKLRINGQTYGRKVFHRTFTSWVQKIMPIAYNFTTQWIRLVKFFRKFCEILLIWKAHLNTCLVIEIFTKFEIQISQKGTHHRIFPVII